MKEYFIDHTEGKLEEIQEFALKHPKKESLDHCFKTLERIRENRNDSEHLKIILYSDWAPMSLAFAIVTTDTSTCVLAGGIIYHGAVDGKKVQNFTVTVNETEGWGLHT